MTRPPEVGSPADAPHAIPRQPGGPDAPVTQDLHDAHDGGPPRPAPPPGRRPLDVERLRSLETAFNRAPSAHNTQPWRLTWHEDLVELGWDERHTLGPSDPVGRDLRLSLGAMIESVLVVAADAGLPADFVTDIDPTWCRVGYFVGAPGLYRTPFDAADVVARRCWRGAWTRDEPSDELLAALRALAFTGGARLVVLDCATLHPLLLEASRWFVSSPDIRAELWAWLRVSGRHPNYHLDGLTDYALGLSWIEARGMEMLLRARRGDRRHRHRAPRHGNPFGLRAMIAKGQAKPFDSRGTVVVLLVPTTTSDDREIEMGRLMQRLWLLVTRFGLSAHPQSLLIDCPATSAWVRALTGAVGERPLWIARIGRPSPRAVPRTPLSPRRVAPGHD